MSRYDHRLYLGHPKEQPPFRTILTPGFLHVGTDRSRSNPLMNNDSHSPAIDRRHLLGLALGAAAGGAWVDAAPHCPAPEVETRSLDELHRVGVERSFNARFPGMSRFMQDQARIERLKTQFEEIIGPVAAANPPGASGVYLLQG